MVARLVVFALLATFSAPSARAQSTDSIIVRVSASRELARDRVIAAFLRVGLRVTETSPSTVTADLGRDRNSNSLAPRLVARAALAQTGEATDVMLWADIVEAATTPGYPPEVKRVSSSSKKELWLWNSLEKVAKAMGER